MRRPQYTPLQIKLETITPIIAKAATYAALVLIIVLLLRFFLDGITKRNMDLFGGESDFKKTFALNFKLWVDYLNIAVAVVVVGIPEGLPLAIICSLANAKSNLRKDNN